MNLQTLQAQLNQLERKRQQLEKRIKDRASRQYAALPAKVGLKSIDVGIRRYFIKTRMAWMPCHARIFFPSASERGFILALLASFRMILEDRSPNFSSRGISKEASTSATDGAVSAASARGAHRV